MKRRMHMTPLEPRERGGLKGFGFTVTFTDHDPPASPQDSEIEGERTHLDRGLPAAPSMQGAALNSEAA